MIISLNKYKGSGGGEKPTEVLTQTITENGSQTFNPQEGYVFSSAEITTDIHPKDALVATIDKNSTYNIIGEYNRVEITTDVHPTEALIATINENGSHSFTGEYNGAEITVGVPTPEGNVDITANGIYNVNNYATASVNVQPSNNYSNFDGVIDTAGLRALGWDDASIGMYRDNDRHYAWQNSDYIVSEENKALNGVIVDKASIRNNRDNPNFKYCPFIRSLDERFTDSLFYDCRSLTSIPLLDTSRWTTMNSMFNICWSLTSIPQLDTRNVTNMNSMFAGCKVLTSIPLLDTSNVTDIGSMFSGCSSLTSIPALDTSNVTNMGNMFNGCSLLTSIPLLDTSNVTNMGDMFSDCSALTSIPLLDTSKVTNMYHFFYNCISLTSIPPLDTTNVTNMSWLLAGCSSLTSIPLLDTTNVTNMDYFFGFSTMDKLTDLGGFKNLSISNSSYFLDRCPNLTVESLMNVINNLSTAYNLTLKFGSVNLRKLTAEQKAIATKKGWTLTD